MPMSNFTNWSSITEKSSLPSLFVSHQINFFETLYQLWALCRWGGRHNHRQHCSCLKLLCQKLPHLVAVRWCYAKSSWLCFCEHTVVLCCVWSLWKYLLLVDMIWWRWSLLFKVRFCVELCKETTFLCGLLNRIVVLGWQLNQSQLKMTWLTSWHHCFSSSLIYKLLMLVLDIFKLFSVFILFVGKVIPTTKKEMMTMKQWKWVIVMVMEAVQRKLMSLAISLLCRLVIRLITDLYSVNLCQMTCWFF